MKKYFSIGEASKAVNLTSETLRHYDRIGLVKPSRKDEWTNYRYYTEEDIVLLNTVRALQMMDLPLSEIKTVLEYNELEKIIEFLTEAEKKADEKISTLYQSKAKIQSAKAAYEKKYRGKQKSNGVFVRYFPERVILLSDELKKPTLENLWNYLSHFYDKIPEAQKNQFDFEDLAGIYTENDVSKLFAVCVKYEKIDSLKRLPEGKYLCADCSEENREALLNELMEKAKCEYCAEPEFYLQIVVISGILHWDYQIQIYLGK